jgi:uncharacterized protein YjiS (DUF1127 family)
VKHTLNECPEKQLEMTMSTTMIAVAPPQASRKHFWAMSPTITIKGRWGSYVMRRMERAAASQLWSMSDRELKDIGLSRSQIMGGVTGELARDRAFSRYC